MSWQLISGNAPSAAHLDQCAQQLQDVLGHELVVERLKKHLAVPDPLPPVMQKRMDLLRRLPFRGIVTTNFSSIVPGKSPHDGTQRNLEEC